MHCAPNYVPYDMVRILKNIAVCQKQFLLLSRNYTTSTTLECINSFRNLKQTSRSLLPEKCMCKNETFCIFRRSPSTTFCERKPSHSPKKLSDLQQSCTMNACTYQMFFQDMLSHVFNPTAEDFLLHQANFYRYSLYILSQKECPWAEQFTSLPKKGVGALSSVSAFNH